jgi:hypothetical protein
MIFPTFNKLWEEHKIHTSWVQKHKVPLYKDPTLDMMNKWCLCGGVGANIAALTTPSHFHATSVIQGHMILDCLNWFLTPTGIFRHWSITNQFHQFYKLFVPLKQVICCLTTLRKAAPYYRMLCKICHECHH